VSDAPFPSARDATLRAIDALIPWADAPADAQKFPLPFSSTSQRVAPDYESAMELITGLGNLAAHLLVLYERATGVPRTVILRDLAQRHSK
jgi:hypothetical protein